MKKLICLLIVLAVSSAANAVLIDSWSDGYGVTWNVTTDIDGSLDLVGYGTSITTTYPYNQTVYLHDGSFTAAGAYITASAAGTFKPGVFNEAGDKGAAVIDGFFGYALEADDLGTETVPDEAIGNWFVFDIDAGTATSATIEIWGGQNSYGSALETSTLDVVPEPATIALLGLGGLFLRRRKKA